MIKNCLACGTPFVTTEARIADGRGKYCSQKCSIPVVCAGNVGRIRPQHSRDKLSATQTGKPHPHKGIVFSDEAKEKIRQKALGRSPSENTRIKMSKSHLGISHTVPEETRKRMSEARKGISHPGICGANHHWWKGGISFEPYCPKFTKEFKERVRAFWGRKCFLCAKTEEETGRRHGVHHVNYDKQVCCNNAKPLFVSLCASCHAKTTRGDRLGWETYLTEQILLATGGECYLSKADLPQVLKAGGA